METVNELEFPPWPAHIMDEARQRTGLVPLEASQLVLWSDVPEIRERRDLELELIAREPHELRTLDGRTYLFTLEQVAESPLDALDVVAEAMRGGVLGWDAGSAAHVLVTDDFSSLPESIGPELSALVAKITAADAA